MGLRGRFFEGGGVPLFANFFECDVPVSRGQ